MKTKEQILKWLDEQPWKGEFYEAVFTLRTDLNLDYNDSFIFEAFCWPITEQGFYVWDERDQAFRKWYKDDKPKSWEEYCKQNPIKAGEYYINKYSMLQEAALDTRDKTLDINVMPKDLCEAFLAYMKLIQLRNAWMKDDKEADGYYKVTATSKGNIIIDSCNYPTSGLSFIFSDVASEFVSIFKDLLEVAKPLL